MMFTGRDDTYICDSRDNPTTCGLVGGNLWDCLKNYDPKRCHYCEDKGDSLVCAVRGRADHHPTEIPQIFTDFSK